MSSGRRKLWSRWLTFLQALANSCTLLSIPTTHHKWHLQPADPTPWLERESVKKDPIIRLSRDQKTPHLLCGDGVLNDGVNRADRTTVGIRHFMSLYHKSEKSHLQRYPFRYDILYTGSVIRAQNVSWTVSDVVVNVAARWPIDTKIYKIRVLQCPTYLNIC